MTPHLWTGINDVRAGAGVAVVGNYKQVAEQLYEFVDAGCSGFAFRLPTRPGGGNFRQARYAAFDEVS
jgi:alkanesulfonate monooxygenase SsuD/methylene tetrahydromethanopterin reductase-like flavin-dependent oxidoreductase (luciferase family)